MGEFHLAILRYSHNAASLRRHHGKIKEMVFFIIFHEAFSALPKREKYAILWQIVRAGDFEPNQ
jgi:hypothetical protein